MSAALQLFGIMMAIFVPISMFIFIAQYFSHNKMTSAKFSELKKQMEKNSNQDLEKEIAGLKERIIVLESIVTDKNYDLDQKISNLG